ncbi:uncharacterized protein LOC17879105 isoform X2 [Capsella rubella]|uniref:uncharacterized protein LOC17879105 isoform X2 n=1 Tax=Capsella rubella TaxID=81985 RepID=UPI000CD5056C|nr:uncharacterized protein LOC17879105 isoform X2 [Capsella rubella]
MNIGEETEVLDPKKNDELVGIKRSFAFIENEDEEEEKSENNSLPDEEEEPPRYNWFLDEISLPLTVVDTQWTLCHVFCKNTKPEFVSLPVMESQSESESQSKSESESDQSEEKKESVDKPAETLDIGKEKDETVLTPPPPSP